MPGGVTLAAPAAREAGAEAIARAVSALELRASTVTVVGYGTMGQHYVRALQRLGVGQIRVCSRSAQRLAPLEGAAGMELHAGVVEQFSMAPVAGEAAIVATPTAALAPAARRLAQLGYRTLLIEKPVSLWSSEIERVAQELERGGTEAFCAYNRTAYPSLHEAGALAAADGGITSCTYTMTEMIKPDWPARFPAAELARWGVANSLHVMTMAHRLIGAPGTWSNSRAGGLSWHPTGSVFVGSGRSERGIAFAYHADWGSTGRWSVELHTAKASYRLCPLERLFRRAAVTADWDELPVVAAAPELKAGVLEQVAALLDGGVRQIVRPVPLREAAAWTRAAEQCFGYAADPEGRAQDRPGG